jgi:ribosome-associated toxin RatA of RatAB toxin-antitoxin module
VEIGGEYFTVVSGGYTIRPLSAERCEVTLRTTYANRSSLQLYGDLWGDFVFDDFHRSILRLIEHRAERA